MAVADVIPYAGNSRTHSDDQVAQVASSIMEFGFTNPIIVDESGALIAGHGRLLAAKKLNMDSVPSVTLKGLTEAQKKAYVIADNKLALNAGWDYELLRLEVESLSEMDFDLGIIGFSDDEFSDILSGWGGNLDVQEFEEPEAADFKIKVSGGEVDKEDVLSTLKRAISESGIEGIKIEAS